jgi:hypothetical protein
MGRSWYEATRRKDAGKLVLFKSRFVLFRRAEEAETLLEPSELPYCGLAVLLAHIHIPLWCVVTLGANAACQRGSDCVGSTAKKRSRRGVNKQKIMSNQQCA